MMNNAGSTLTEYALIAALVSIVVLAVGGGLRFPWAPVAALSEVASGPRELGSPGLGSELRAHPQGGRSYAGAASGPGPLGGAGTNSAFPMPDAGAIRPAQGTGIGSTATASPQLRGPDPSDPTHFNVGAAMAATLEPEDDPTGGANPTAPGKENPGWGGRQSGDRSAGGGKAAGIRPVLPRRPARRSGPAAEQLVSLRPGSEAVAPTLARASVGETAGSARGAAAREIRTRATSGTSRPSARPDEARATVVTSTIRGGERRLWALAVLMLAGLGFGAHRLRRRRARAGPILPWLARRLQSMGGRARNP